MAKREGERRAQKPKKVQDLSAKQARIVKGGTVPGTLKWEDITLKSGTN
jgi:hypothetical protein